MVISENVLLNVANVVVGSYTNGPGKRIVIWVQGCTINCKGCFNEELQPHAARHLVDPELFAIKIVDLCKDNKCEGVTLSGGEPFQQSKALTKFIGVIKDNSLTVTCFSGYKSTTLLNSKDPDVIALLRKIDILIAGKFNATNKYSNRTWYENPDKNIIFLTSTYDSSDARFDESVEYIIKDDYLCITGFPDLVDNWKKSICN